MIYEKVRYRLEKTVGYLDISNMIFTLAVAPKNDSRTRMTYHATHIQLENRNADAVRRAGASETDEMIASDVAGEKRCANLEYFFFNFVIFHKHCC